MAEATKMLVNGVKCGSDLMVPGSSLMMDGNVKGGLLHVAGGVLAASWLGPIGWILAGANSYSNSVTGKHLHRHFSDSDGKADDKTDAKS